ncbi:MAG: hypothetical protein J6Y31_00180 [Bacteroidales bacterium]|nr:hypothetical protein [Bacteroidales bacterium]
MTRKNLPCGLRRFIAALVGLVFLASGLLKLADPTGTGLIVAEYGKFLHLGFSAGLAKGLGIVLSLGESLLGIALVSGVLRKIAAWATLVVLGLFSVLTLALWIVNPEMDCGCFGEAIHLSHAQSFWKNIVLLGLSLAAFLPLDSIGKPKARKWIAAGLATAGVLIGCIYSNRHLPLVDFTAFAPGAELFASLDNDYQESDGYTPAFVYEKDGQQGTFTLDHLPDSSWTFVRADSLYRLPIGRSEQKPILSFSDAEGNYKDEEAVLGKRVVFSVYRPEKVHWGRLQRHYNAAAKAGGRPLLLVSGTPESLDAVNVPIELEAFYSDYKTLITLNRSNGGASYFADGELIGKWAARDFPKDIAGQLAANPVDLSNHLSSTSRIKAQGFVLYLLAILLLI